MPLISQRFSRAAGALAEPRKRLLRLLFGALLLVPAGIGSAADADIRHLRCTNPASGTSWSIVVDLGHRRVDAQPATITGSSISWRDAKYGAYDLDRATGNLRFRYASSTGGSYLYYTCRPE